MVYTAGISDKISYCKFVADLKTNVHFEDDLEKDKLIELLLDRKLKLNNTSDEGNLICYYKNLLLNQIKSFFILTVLC